MTSCTEKLRQTINSHQIVESSILDEFLAVFHEEEIKKGDFFVEAEQTISKVAFICNGIFRAYFTDYSGKEITQVFLLEDDFIVSRLIPYSKSLLNVQAIKTSKVLVADINKVNDLIQKYHAIAKFYIKIVSIYFDKNQDREINLRILDAARKYEYFLQMYPNLINQIPHYYVASHLQISSTHLSRIRKELQAKGYKMTDL